MLLLPNLQSALDAVNRQHLIVTLITEIHLHDLAAVTLSQAKVSCSGFTAQLIGEV